MGFNEAILDIATIYPPIGHWIWLVPAFMVGACIGSFLNVVIYRVPLGLSVNSPKRSFCPSCKKAIPMWLNLPLISWLWLRGKCKECRAPIAFCYLGVELLTAVLFSMVWWLFVSSSVAVVPILWLLMALLVAITFIDAEHLIIPTSLTWLGSAAGLIACAIWPQLPMLAGDAQGTLSSVLHGLIGWAIGFFGLWGVVELGKIAFGKKSMKFVNPVEWSLREPTNDQDPMTFAIADELIPWWDIFARKSDRLLVEATEIEVSGEAVGGGSLIIRDMEIELPNGKIYQISDIKSLAGKATSAVIPREAMGMGDVHLLGMIGAFFGWGGVLFTLFASSVFAILAAVIGRIGFGRQLPFGPFLAMGALAWMVGGWRLWEWYMNAIAPLGAP